MVEFYHYRQLKKVYITAGHEANPNLPHKIKIFSKRVMITQVHIHPKVEKLIKQMRKQGKVPLIAAKRTEIIIKNLVQGVRPIMAGFFSKDARIKNLYKFNLGSGYRLICIKEKYNIFILFIGIVDPENWTMC